MTFFIIAGVFSALAILFLLLKLDIRKILFFDFFVDITSTLFLVAVFFGTFAGMMAAVIGGAIISVSLFIMKKFLGYKKPIRKKYWYEWVNVPPTHTK